MMDLGFSNQMIFDLKSIMYIFRKQSLSSRLKLKEDLSNKTYMIEGQVALKIRGHLTKHLNDGFGI